MSNKWAVLIGINGYHESLGSLKFCMNDAKLMQETLLSDCCEFTPDNVKGGDWVGASAYAHSMGRFGVDLGSGAAAVCMVAELAENNGDKDTAKAVYRCASHVWQSPHAKVALAKFDEAPGPKKGGQADAV